jgi:hypothetical protein
MHQAKVYGNTDKGFEDSASSLPVLAVGWAEFSDHERITWRIDYMEFRHLLP